jgi:hypothetical protein
MSFASTARSTATSPTVAAAASTLVLIGAAGLIASATIHIADAPDTLSEVTYIGVGFLLQAVASIVAAVLAVRGSRAGLLLGLAVAAGSIAMYTISRTIGLPGQEGEIWLEPAGVVALVSQAVTVITFGIALRATRSR